MVWGLRGGRIQLEIIEVEQLENRLGKADTGKNTEVVFEHVDCIRHPRGNV